MGNRDKLTSPVQKRIIGFSPNVFFLGLVSFLTDVSSEMIFTILPLFLANVLGVKTPIIGLIEGIAESTAALTKLFSGWLSDKLGKRKTLAAAGYALSSLAKPFLYFANAWGLVLAIRFSDRLGKGIRTSPRDALVADSTPSAEMGKSFGFHRAMDTGGAVIGLALAAAIVFLLQRGSLNLSKGTYQVLVLAGTVPAIIAVFLIIKFIHDVKQERSETDEGQNVAPNAAVGFDPQFKMFLGIMALFTLSNSSDAFLILRAQNLGSSVFQILIMMTVFNITYALSSLPAGLLSDKLGRRGIIAVGWSIYGLVYLGFALASASWQVWLLFIVYGLYYGATEGVARAFVADVVSSQRRGTAYGLYHTAVGITALPASIIAGLLWQAISPAAPFVLGAILSGISAIALLTLIRH